MPGFSSLGDSLTKSVAGEKRPSAPHSSTTSLPPTFGTSNSTLGWAALEAPVALDCGDPGEEDDAQAGKIFGEEMSKS